MNAPKSSWMKARVSGSKAEAEWPPIIESIWDHAKTVPVSTLIKKERLTELVHAHFDEEHLAQLLLPAASPFARWVVEELKQDQEPLKRFWSRAAIDKAKALAARPGLVNAAWIEAIFKEEAIERIANDTLYRVLKEFSTIVPRVVSNLPILRRLPIVGRKGLGTKLIEEVERLLEPEIKHFLKGGTTRALDRAARFAIDHLEDPPSVATRKNAIQFVLDHSPAFHLGPIDDGLNDALAEVVTELAKEWAKSDAARAWVDEAIDKLYTRYGDEPLENLLEDIGIKEPPPFAALSRLTFELWQAVLDAPELEAAFLRLEDEAPG